MLWPVTRAQFPLTDAYLAKGLRYMREVRRAIEAYWYATMEDPEATALEVRRVASAVNILDETVFLHAFGDSYRRHRARDPLGKVVMGLELIRNCEEHSPVLFDGLLVPGAHFSVPMYMGHRRNSVTRDDDALHGDRLPRCRRSFPAARGGLRRRPAPPGVELVAPHGSFVVVPDCDGCGRLLRTLHSAPERSAIGPRECGSQSYAQVRTVPQSHGSVQDRGGRDLVAENLAWLTGPVERGFGCGGSLRSAAGLRGDDRRSAPDTGERRAGAADRLGERVAGARTIVSGAIRPTPLVRRSAWPSPACRNSLQRTCSEYCTQTHRFRWPDIGLVSPDGKRQARAVHPSF